MLTHMHTNTLTHTKAYTQILKNRCILRHAQTDTHRHTRGPVHMYTDAASHTDAHLFTKWRPLTGTGRGRLADVH